MIDMDKETFDKETIENLRYIAAVSGSSISQIAEALERLCDAVSESVKRIESIFRDIEEMHDVADTPVALKKQIKYCKNPMEKQMLQKKLNEVYKKNKRRKHGRKHFT